MKRLIKWLVGHTGESLSRVVMDRTTLDWVGHLDHASMDALEISGDQWRHRLGFRSYRNVWHPDYDVCAQVLDGRFDIILAEQVLHHVLFPLRAAKNVFEMLRPGGYFLVTTAFLYRAMPPQDCTRWTELGLKHLLVEAGWNADAIRTASWGNKRAVKTQLTGRNYCRRLHSLKNDPIYPIVVWALAKKAGK